MQAIMNITHTACGSYLTNDPKEDSCDVVTRE